VTVLACLACTISVDNDITILEISKSGRSMRRNMMTAVAKLGRRWKEAVAEREVKHDDGGGERRQWQSAWRGR
jgi:hypothetical protein